MGTAKAKKYIILILIFLIAFPALSQNFTQKEIKAAFIFSFAKYVTWKNESALFQFHIAVAGSEEDYNTFKSICAGRMLKDVPIVITRLEDFSDIPHANVLFVSHSNCDKLKDIKKKLKTNTLLVSDNCVNEDDIMINFTDNVPDRKFELNIRNILFAGLEISRKIVTLGGGQEANWQDLYVKTDKELISTKEILAEQKDEIKRQQKILYEKSQLVQRKEKELRLKQFELKRKTDEIRQKEDILEKQDQKISKQESTINTQLEKIGEQRLILLLFIFILIMMIAFAFLMLRSYRIKKKANKQLEQKNTEIHRQKDEIVWQSKELETKNQQLEKLSIVASKTDNSVVIANADGEIDWVNEGFTRLLGYSLEEFKEEIGSNVLSASANPDIRAMINKSIDNKKSVVYTVKNKTKWGNDIWIQTTLTPILDEFGELSKLVAIDTDITQIKLQEERIRKQKQIIEEEKEKSEKLLLNVLPEVVANDLKKKGKTLPEVFENVTVYFSDVVGFTKMSTSLNPQELIDELNDIFTEFDNIIERNECERIKTIGDAYLMVCGMPKNNPNHAENVVKSSLEIIKYLKQRNIDSKIKWEIRIGIHTGKVVGGVVGIKKYIYDVFGDTINTASRMESNSEPMKINVSEITYNLIKDKFIFKERELIEVKGKGTMKMFFVEGKNL
ncbi:MAG: hypothetical protein C0594_12305 [Marinilabiliales bacterium]|nr:MAG: hypothetical protein C0594_12305 [Marinilabiliales bacterium]